MGVVSALARRGVDLRLRGVFNVESGRVAFSSIRPRFCECAGNISGRPDNPCADCGRDSDNTAAVASGFGDGIYPVLTLHDSGSHKGVIGVATVFELRSDFVQAVHQSVERGVPPFPAEDRLSWLENLSVIRLGEIDTNGELFISDASAGDGRDAVVDVSGIAVSRLALVLLVEPRETTDQAELSRLTDIYGYSEQMARAEMAGHEAAWQVFPPGKILPTSERISPFTVRALVAVAPDYLDLFSAHPVFPEPDWTVQVWREMAGPVMAHRSPRHELAIWLNAKIWMGKHQGIDQPAELGLPEPEHLEPLSWILQGIHNGDSDCETLLTALGGNFSQSDYVHALSRRGLEGELLPSPEDGNDSAGRAGPGLSLTGAGGGTVGRKNFCTSCGAALLSGAKFCSQCGSAIA